MATNYSITAGSSNDASVDVVTKGASARDHFMMANSEALSCSSVYSKYPARVRIFKALECTAIMLNINYGYNQELMEKCQTLHDYSYFVETVRQGVRAGKHWRKL